MICRVTGRIQEVSELRAVLEAGDLAYELLLPACAVVDLERRIGETVTLYTIHYLEGTPTGSTLTPRLIGFPTPADRGFFTAMTRVKGISYRKALRAMSLPARQLAAAIENGDERLLVGLPDIGRKTAQQIIAELRGKLGPLSTEPSTASPARTLTPAQQTAIEILVQWGDRRADAQRWVLAAMDADPELTEPDQIVRAAYRTKQSE